MFTIWLFPGKATLPLLTPVLSALTPPRGIVTTSRICTVLCVNQARPGSSVPHDSELRSGSSRSTCLLMLDVEGITLVVEVPLTSLNSGAGTWELVVPSKQMH
jgi:hypothetical protein